MRTSDDLLELMGKLVVGDRDYGQFRGSGGAEIFAKAGRTVTRPCPATGWEAWATEQLRLWLDVDERAIETLLTAMAARDEFLDRENRVKETARRAQIERWNGFLAPHGWRIIPTASGAAVERTEPTYLPAEDTPNMAVPNKDRVVEMTRALFEDLVREGESVLATRFEHQPDSFRTISYVDTAQSAKWSTNVVAFLVRAFGEASVHCERAKQHQTQSFLYMQAVQLLAVLRGAAEAFEKGFLELKSQVREPDKVAPCRTNSMSNAKPRIFIGSSVEGLPVAEHVQLGLDHHAECTVWSQGVFGLSGGNLDSLLRAAKDYEFAVLVLTPDDMVHKRDTTMNSPRDNVLFELGLFMGALGRDRTYIVYCRDDKPDLPTDLAGVTPATFAKRSDGNLQAAIGPVCVQIRTAIAAARATTPSP